MRRFLSRLIHDSLGQPIRRYVRLRRLGKAALELTLTEPDATSAVRAFPDARRVTKDTQLQSDAAAETPLGQRGPIERAKHLRKKRDEGKLDR